MRELIDSIVDDAQRLWVLELELIKQEAQEILIGNLWAFGMMIGSGTLLYVVLFVAIPIVIIEMAGHPLPVTLAWLFFDTVTGAVLGVIGYRRFRVPDIKTTRSARAVLETREWLLREMSSNGKADATASPRP